MKVIGSNLAYVFAFGGLGALPFSFLAKAIYAAFTDPEDDWERLIYENIQNAEVLPEFVKKPLARTLTRGLPATIGNDMSWRVEGTDIFGAPIGFQTAKQIYRKARYHAIEPVLRGEEWHTLLMAMPDMIANPYKAFIAEGGTGIEGRPPIEYTGRERAWKAMGFTPTRESETRTAQHIAWEKREQRLDKIRGWADKWLKADQAEKAALRKEIIAEYKKEKAKGKQGVPITVRNVIDSAKRRKKAREKGYEERLPKYMRPFQRDTGRAFGLNP